MDSKFPGGGGRGGESLYLVLLTAVSWELIKGPESHPCKTFYEEADLPWFVKKGSACLGFSSRLPSDYNGRCWETMGSLGWGTILWEEPGCGWTALKTRESWGSSPWQAALQSDTTLPSLCRGTGWAFERRLSKIDHFSETTSDLKCECVIFSLLMQTDHSSSDADLTPRYQQRKEPKAHLTRVVVQSPSRVRLFVTPWTAACQVSLSFTVSLSLLQLVSIESVMPSRDS